MTEQEKTLCEALSFARIEELPAEATDALWGKAIALVTKTTNRQSYAIVRNDDGRYSVIKDFGAIATIISVDKVYPYEGGSGAPIVVMPTAKNVAVQHSEPAARRPGRPKSVETPSENKAE